MEITAKNCHSCCCFCFVLFLFIYLFCFFKYFSIELFKPLFDCRRVNQWIRATNKRQHIEKSMKFSTFNICTITKIICILLGLFEPNTWGWWTTIFSKLNPNILMSSEQLWLILIIRLTTTDVRTDKNNVINTKSDIHQILDSKWLLSRLLWHQIYLHLLHITT